MATGLAKQLLLKTTTDYIKDITSEFTMSQGYIEKVTGDYYAYASAESTDFLDIYMSTVIFM